MTVVKERTQDLVLFQETKPPAYSRREFFGKAARLGGAIAAAGVVYEINKIRGSTGHQESHSHSSFDDLRTQIADKEGTDLHKVRTAKSRKIQLNPSLQYKIVRIGDSIMQGVCQDDTAVDEQGKRHRVDDIGIITTFIYNAQNKGLKLQEADIKGTYQGGKTSAKVLDLVKNAHDDLIKVENPVYLVSVGANDLFKLADGVDSDFLFHIEERAPKKITDTITQYKANLENMIDELPNHEGRVILTLLPNIMTLQSTQDYIQKKESLALYIPGKDKEIKDSILYALVELDLAMIKTANANNLAFVNLFDYKIDSSLVCSDGLHPNHDGYSDIGEKMSELI